MPINHLFNHPYTKIDFLMKTLNVSRPSAAKYLDELTEGGFLHKEKMGRSNYLYQYRADEYSSAESRLTRLIAAVRILAMP